MSSIAESLVKSLYQNIEGVETRPPTTGSYDPRDWRFEYDADMRLPIVDMNVGDYGQGISKREYDMLEDWSSKFTEKLLSKVRAEGGDDYYTVARDAPLHGTGGAFAKFGPAGTSITGGLEGGPIDAARHLMLGYLVATRPGQKPGESNIGSLQSREFKNPDTISSRPAMDAVNNRFGANVIAPMFGPDVEGAKVFIEDIISDMVFNKPDSMIKGKITNESIESLISKPAIYEKTYKKFSLDDPPSTDEYDAYRLLSQLESAPPERWTEIRKMYTKPTGPIPGSPKKEEVDNKEYKFSIDRRTKK
jgi:hypothetical protein